jgi:hypothetical protein
VPHFALGGMSECAEANVLAVAPPIEYAADSREAGGTAGGTHKLSGGWTT